MKYGWKRAVSAIGSLLVAGIVAATAPEEADAAAKTESLRVYVDGTLSQLTARNVGGKAYISADGASALGVKVRADDNGSYIIEFGEQTSRVAKKDAITISNQLHVPIASVAGALKARWVEDRLTSSLFVFQRAGASSAGGATAPAASAPAPDGNAAAQPSPGDSVTVSDAVPTFTGIKLEDGAVSFTTTGNVVPKVFQLRNPDRIVLDLPGTTLERSPDGNAGGAVEVGADHPYLSGVRYSLFEVNPATVRIVLDLKQSVSYRLELSADGSGGTVKFSEKQFRIMIDAGHGGHDPGAVSVSGKFEKDITLAVAKKTAALMEKEKLLQPVLVRTEDVYSSPAERARIANAAGVDLYVSIHANTASSSSVRGTETYYWNEKSKSLAETIHSNVLKAINSSDRKVKKNNYLVVRETAMPSVLLELGFLTNPDDEAKLLDEKIQDKIAAAIVTSIKQYYSIP